MEELKMIDLVLLLFWLAPVAYVVGYIYAFMAYILPWLSVPIPEILKMTLWQLVATGLFFTLGFSLFIVAIIFIVGLISNW